MWKLAAGKNASNHGGFILIEDSFEDAKMVCFCMKHIQGTSRSQTLLLPACVDDYVGPDNMVRFIEAFVESLDLAATGFARARPKATGRLGYDPSDLLKLYIYGYLNRVRSSRRLEAETPESGSDLADTAVAAKLQNYR